MLSVGICYAQLAADGKGQVGWVMVQQQLCRDWHARKEKTRLWLWERSKEQWAEKDLADKDIDWIMWEEEYETCILSWRPDNEDWYSTPASGGR